MEQRPRILVVEPNRAYLGVLARRLGEAGFLVTTSDCATSAIAELHRRPVDLVLAELNMPRFGGAELARLIRDAGFRDLPLMVITGKSRPSGAVRAYEAGADDVILKPFHFEVLFARIERRIARAEALKRLMHDNAALDARVVERAIALAELRDRLAASEAELRRREDMDAAKAG
jgi:DNA-binding response OmpR family regulator